MEILKLLFIVLAVAHVRRCSQSLSEFIKLTDENGQDGDRFGSWHGIASNEKYVAVGAYGDDEGGITDVGSVTVFEKTSNGINTAGTKILPPDRQIKGAFGSSLAMNEEFIVIGAQGWKGRVYIYSADEQRTFQQKLQPNEVQMVDRFGSSVAISKDNVIIVGAHGRDDERGAAYVFTYTNSRWSLLQKLQPVDLQPNHWFGWGISVTQNHIAVAAHGQRLSAGAVYVYGKRNGLWEEKQILSPVDSPTSYFGYTVKVEDRRMVVGALGEDKLSGRVYVYELVNNEWIPESILRGSDTKEGDQFGSTVALHEKGIVVAARSYRFNDDVFNAGVVYVFQPNAYLENWEEKAKLKATDISSNDYFGISLAVYKNFVFSGSQNLASGNSKGAVVTHDISAVITDE